MSTPRHQCVDIKTGRKAKVAAGFGKTWKTHQNLTGWWLLSIFECKRTDYPDGHTWEVCAHNVGPNFSSPTWPILAFHDRDDAEHWFREVRGFLKTLPSEDAHAYYDGTVNGDRRLAAWLTEQGFVRYNHMWWVLKGE